MTNEQILREDLEKALDYQKELETSNSALLEACKRAESVLGIYQAPALKALHSIVSQAINQATK